MKNLNTFNEFVNESLNREISESRGFTLHELRIKANTILRELGVRIPTEKQIADFVDNLKTLIKDEKLGIVMEGESLNEGVDSLDSYYKNADKSVRDSAKKIDAILNKEIKSDATKKEVLDLIIDMVEEWLSKM